MAKYVKDRDGLWHTYYDQSKTDSCMPTCARMFIEKITGNDPGEGPCRRAVELAENGGNLNTVEVFASENGPAPGFGSHNWGGHGGHGSGLNTGGSGTIFDPLLRGIQSMHVSLRGARIRTGNPWTYYQQTSVKKPGIGAVLWSGGGGHALLILGAYQDGNVRVLDPINGVQEIRQEGVGAGYYVNGVREGDCHDEVILL
jgi:hypothetical protein